MPRINDTIRLDWLMKNWKYVHLLFIRGKWLVYFHSSPISDEHDNYRKAIDQAMEELE